MNANQVSCVSNRFITGSGRLISDVFEINNSLDIEGLIITANIENFFDSINHSFLMCVLKNLNLVTNWIHILIKISESCVINGGKTTPYFKLERRTRQGDPI